MQKTVHVNAYTKRDGTHVKEHERIIDVVLNSRGCFPNDTKLPKIGLPDPVKNSISRVLEGGVSVDVYPEGNSGNADGGGFGDVLGSIGGVLGTVFAVGLELAPIALQMYQAMNSGNSQAVNYLKPQFDTKIKQLDTQVAQMKTNIDNNVAKLVNVKNKIEYSKIYEPLQKDWQAYQHAKNIVNRIKVHANNGDFQSVANDLGNFTSENLNQIVNQMNPNTQAIENIYKGLSTTVQNVKPEIDKIAKVAKYSKGPLYFFNNYANYNRPEARQFMDLSLNLPKDTYSNSEYSMIQPIFNEKFNEYLRKIGTELQVTKNMKGIVFDKSSPISQKLSNFEQLQKDIRTNYNEDIKYISGLGIDTDTNLQYAVGHFTILNPRIENGIFKGELFDIYDFDWINLNDLDSIKGVIINNIAFLLQIIRLKNYYFLIPIEFIW